MTALKKYQRLECLGLWREVPGAQRREVIVSFREASLIISDPRSEVPLTHWSLPAVGRLNPGEAPALYSPAADAFETLELEDETMINALETVHQVVEAQQPHPGRMRGWLVGSILAAAVAAAVFWVPGALIAHTAQVVPFAKRQEIGHAVLADLSRLTGQPCGNAAALQPLQRMTRSLFGRAPVEIDVLRDSPVPSAHLPGDIIVVNRRLLENYDTPDVVAGYLLTEDVLAQDNDPLIPLLHWAGLRATFELLTTGNLPAAKLKGYAENLLARRPDAIPQQELLDRFRSLGIPATPYAHAADPGGTKTAMLVDGDPFSTGPAPRPILNDDDWVALQGICTE